MGTLETVQVTSDGSGFGGAWHLDHVEVWNMATGECTAFPCGKWLTPKDPMSLQQVSLRSLSPIHINLDNSVTDGRCSTAVSFVSCFFKVGKVRAYMRMIVGS
jgi:hypothetical protein